ncbi:MAG: ECF transporter S component [Bacilli bacterium]|nr:ECF transporter S component [Bacilli bacterium]
MNNALSIVGLVGMALVLILFLSFLKTTGEQKYNPHERILSMTFDAFFIAVLLLMTFVPNLGFIAVTPFISFTLMHLPVLLGAALGGPKKGILYGFVFGVASYIQALSSAGFNALFAFPWVAIPPRLLFGLAAGLVFGFVGKVSQTKTRGLYLTLGSALLTFLHTGLVFLDLYIFYPAEITGLFSSTSPVAAGTGLTFLLIIVIGMLGEMAIAALVIPPLYLATSKVRQRFKQR